MKVVERFVSAIFFFKGNLAELGSCVKKFWFAGSPVRLKAEYPIAPPHLKPDKISDMRNLKNQGLSQPA
jgi:hypothetical protein